MKAYIFLIITLTIFKAIQSRALNKSILIEQFGYSLNSDYIDLSGQNIDLIDVNTFDGFDQLEELYLEKNKINKIENGLFNKLTKLRELWLESNAIVSIDRNSFFGSNDLELVCLSKNPVSVLFPNSLASICETNKKCVVKITEICIRKESSTTYATSTTTTTTTTKAIQITTTKAPLTITPLATLTGHSDWVQALAVLPSSEMIVSGS